MSIVRQELDSMVRCIYLLDLELNQRNQLMAFTINGERWRNSRNRIIIDRDMVNLSKQLLGWTKSVYDFGVVLYTYQIFMIIQTLIRLMF